MIDDDDLDFTILAWPSGGWIITILGIIVIVVMAIVVAQNKEECAEKHCEHGQSVLLDHECRCLENPVD